MVKQAHQKKFRSLLHFQAIELHSPLLFRQFNYKTEERETEPKLRWSLRGRVPTVKEWPAKVVRIRSYADEIPISASYREAMCSPDREKWKVANQEEFQSLFNNGTWLAVTCPEGAKATGSK
jgi:hypothetical protein